MDEQGFRESDMERGLRGLSEGLGELRGELRYMRTTVDRTWEKVEAMSLHESMITELAHEVRDLSKKLNEHIEGDEPFSDTVGKWATRIVSSAALAMGTYLLYRLPQIIEILER